MIWVEADGCWAQVAHCLQLCSTLYVLGMVDKLERSDLGVAVGGKWCRGLLYANNIKYLVETGAELQLILSLVGKICC